MKAGKIIWYFSFFWIALLSISTFEYLGLKPDTGFLKFKQAAVISGWYLPAFYSHIFGSSVILICGFFQFSDKIAKNIYIHRLLGRIYIFGILSFAAPGAFVMTFFINRGTGVFLSFIIQNVLWVIFTASALLAIKAGNIHKHILMIKRSYALAFAAVMLRFYIWLFSILGYGTNFKYNYLIISLLSWVPNLIFIEWLNYRKRHSYEPSKEQ